MNIILAAVLALFVYNYIIINTFCDETIEISCSSQYDCKSFEDKFVSSYCESICICINRKTNEKVSCSPKNVKRHNLMSVQECVNGTALINGRCLPINVHLGKSCEFSQQCAQNAECKGICLCKDNFIEKDDVCRSVIKIDKCTENYQCKENSECYKEKCVCSKSFISSLNFLECLPFGSYNNPCLETIQCEMGLGAGAVCEEKLCKCGPNYTVIKNENNDLICAKIIYAGDTCILDSNCKFDDNPKMYCEDGKCKCLENFVSIESNGKKVCMKNSDIHNMHLTSKAISDANIALLLIVICLILFFAIC